MRNPLSLVIYYDSCFADPMSSGQYRFKHLEPYASHTLSLNRLWSQRLSCLLTCVWARVCFWQAESWEDNHHLQLETWGNSQTWFLETRAKNPLNCMNASKKQSKTKANRGEKLGLKVTGKVEPQEEVWLMEDEGRREIFWAVLCIPLLLQEQFAFPVLRKASSMRSSTHLPQVSARLHSFPPVVR